MYRYMYRHIYIKQRIYPEFLISCVSYSALSKKRISVYFISVFSKITHLLDVEVIAARDLSPRRVLR